MPETDATITINSTVAATNADSEPWSIAPRDPKGSVRYKGGKSGKRGRKEQREKTPFGKAFKNQYNTPMVRNMVQSLRVGRVARPKRDVEDPRREILQELLRLLQVILSGKQGDEGHYKDLEESLKSAISPKGSPLDETRILGFVDSFDSTVSWLEGEREGAFSTVRASKNNLLVGAAVGAFVLGQGLC